MKTINRAARQWFGLPGLVLLLAGSFTLGSCQKDNVEPQSKVTVGQKNPTPPVGDVGGGGVEDGDEKEDKPPKNGHGG